MKRQLTCEAVLAIAVIAFATQISLQAALTEELHKSYPLDANPRETPQPYMIRGFQFEGCDDADGI